MIDMITFNHMSFNNSIHARILDILSEFDSDDKNIKMSGEKG